MLVSDLENQPDYSVQSAFRTVDRFNEGYLTVPNLTDFFRHNGLYLIQNEVYAIIRRLDVDGDARIGFEEFKYFFEN